MPKKISRQEEAAIPEFNSHDEAKVWFEERYGEDFQCMHTETIAGEKCYFYYLILDHEAYMKGIKEMREKGSVAGFEFLDSHQPIQIMQSGDVHIVH